MKVRYIKSVEVEKEIETPYYFDDSFYGIGKAYEDYFLRLHDERLEIINRPLQTAFYENQMERFIEIQPKLKADFEEDLEAFLQKVNK